MHRTRIALAAVTLLALSACGKSSKSRTASAEKDPDKARVTAVAPGSSAVVTAEPHCAPVPPPGPKVSWMPADLPMPAGTYVAQELTVSPPSKGAVFVVPGTIRQYVQFVTAEFPKAGFHLGRGDAEADEAEDSFSRGNSAGAFRARQPYCDVAKTEVQLTYVADLQAARTTTTQP